ncbi:MAG TPA: heme exporter protein CcmD [Devosia sp.]
MIDLGPHALFILWAYVGVAVAVVGLIGWTLYDARTTTRKLVSLEARRQSK